ncbi:hypothetical protein BKA82DRAFT_4182045, partial [Pisolithus tinctorius]
WHVVFLSFQEIISVTLLVSINLAQHHHTSVKCFPKHWLLLSVRGICRSFPIFLRHVVASRRPIHRRPHSHLQSRKVMNAQAFSLVRCSGIFELNGSCKLKLSIHPYPSCRAVLFLLPREIRVLARKMSSRGTAALVDPLH